MSFKLKLLARFHPDFSRDVLITEIEANSRQYHVDSQLTDNFRKYQHYKNCLYFFHDFACADIPSGQEYEVIMPINRGKIELDSVIRCKATVLCFFSEFKIQPMACAPYGHHGSCLIQFHDKIPDIIQGLYEITEKKPIEMKQELYICSVNALKAYKLQR